MIFGKVIGNLWSTIQEPEFNGAKLMLVQPVDPESRRPDGHSFLAVDVVSAGVGDTVLVVYEGSSSRLALRSERTPCEAIIVGLVDQVDVRMDAR